MDYGAPIVIGGAGNDTITSNNNGVDGGNFAVYRFDLNDGQDVIDDIDYASDWDDDTIEFGSSVDKNTVAIYQDSDDLVIGYGTSDKITVLGNFLTQRTMERLELSTGEYLTDADVNQVIQDMTAYADANSINLTSVEDVKNNQELMNIIANSWNAA